MTPRRALDVGDGWAAVGKLELHGGGQLGQAAITCNMRSPILHKVDIHACVPLLLHHHPVSVLVTVASHSHKSDGGPAFLFAVDIRCLMSSHPAGPKRQSAGSRYLWPPQQQRRRVSHCGIHFRAAVVQAGFNTDVLRPK